MLKKFFKAYSKKIVHYTIKFLKWSLLSVITGLVVGGLSTFFAFCMNTATEYRTQNDYLLFFLPLAGIVTVFLYSIFKYKNKPASSCNWE